MERAEEVGSSTMNLFRAAPESSYIDPPCWESLAAVPSSAGWVNLPAIVLYYLWASCDERHTHTV